MNNYTNNVIIINGIETEVDDREYLMWLRNNHKSISIDILEELC